VHNLMQSARPSSQRTSCLCLQLESEVKAALLTARARILGPQWQRQEGADRTAATGVASRTGPQSPAPPPPPVWDAALEHLLMPALAAYEYVSWTTVALIGIELVCGGVCERTRVHFGAVIHILKISKHFIAPLSQAVSKLPHGLIKV
jgi:hypothetical protein